MEKKKILVVSMSAELGGIEKSLINFLNFLEKEDCETDLLLWKKQGELLPSIPQNVHFIDNVAPGNLREIIKERKYRNFLAYLKLKFFNVFQMPWKALQKIDKKYDIAVSYTQDGYSPYFVIDNVCADRKFLWYHHGAYSKSEDKRKQDNRYYSKFTKIISVSESNKDMLINNFRSIQDKFIVIKNLINEEQIIELAQEQCSVFEGFDGCKITTVGRVSPEKGQLNALDAAKELKDRGFCFKWCFVGDGPEMASCIGKVKALDLEDKCIFVGAQANPYPYIEAADLYVQLSFVEADPVTIQEALVLDKTIVASNIAPMEEALRDNPRGRLCATDCNEAAEAITDAANDVLLKGKNESKSQKTNVRNQLIEEKLQQLFEF